MIKACLIFKTSNPIAKVQIRIGFNTFKHKFSKKLPKVVHNKCR